VARWSGTLTKKKNCLGARSAKSPEPAEVEIGIGIGIGIGIEIGIGIGIEIGTEIWIERTWDSDTKS